MRSSMEKEFVGVAVDLESLDSKPRENMMLSNIVPVFAKLCSKTLACVQPPPVRVPLFVLALVGTSSVQCE